MTFQPRISTLGGANLFWNRYSIEIAEHGRTEYSATFKSGKMIKADTLTLLWHELGDLLFRGGAAAESTIESLKQAGIDG